MRAGGQTRAAHVRQEIRRGLRRAALRPGKVAEALGRREELAIRYLRGDGIEIGALIHPLWVPPRARVRYVDNLSREDLLSTANVVYGDESLSDAVAVDVVDDGSVLAKFADASLDFVIANHVLEHLEDPVATLGHWLRVLRPGGILMITLPDPRHSFDAARPRTTVEHLLRDHRDGPAVSRREHLREFAQIVEAVPGERLEARVAELERQTWSIHFHVWELQDFLRLLLALDLPARIEVAQEVAPEFAIILRKV